MISNKRNEVARKVVLGLALLLLVLVLVWGTPDVQVRVGLTVFGIGYDQFVTYLHRAGREKGATALLVVLGTGVTLAGAGVLVGWDITLRIVELFGYSGTPMIVGAWVRYTDERIRDETEARQLASKGLGAGDDDTHS